MNVVLAPEVEKLVLSQVENGRYMTASDAVKDAMRLLDEVTRLQAFQRSDVDEKIKAGMDSLRRGEGMDGDEFFDRLEAELEYPDFA